MPFSRVAFELFEIFIGAVKVEIEKIFKDGEWCEKFKVWHQRKEK